MSTPTDDNSDALALPRNIGRYAQALGPTDKRDTRRSALRSEPAGPVDLCGVRCVRPTADADLLVAGARDALFRRCDVGDHAGVTVLELEHDPETSPWGRLLAIGGVEIRYCGHRPSAIGDRQIGYDPPAGGRLAHVGDRDVRHRIWMGTVKQLGDWRVRYWPIVPLLRGIGPFVVEHRGPWLRPSLVGPATLVYEPGKRYPRTAVVEPSTTQVSDELLLAVAFALLEHLWRPTGG